MLTMSEALDEAGMTDDKLAEKHTELLNKREVIVVHEGRESHAEVTDQPDTQAVKAGLDMAYKIKGHYAAERLEHTGKDGEPLDLIFVRSEKELKDHDATTPGSPPPASAG